MKPALVALALLLLGACAFPPLDEIDYTGAPLADGVDPFAEAEKFAIAWSAHGALEIISRTKPSGLARYDSSAQVSLKSIGNPKVVAHVIVYAPRREVRVMIIPASALPVSEDIASAAVRAYEQLYGASEFKRWQRYQGLFGP